jgi:hypothetical protein
MNALTNFIYARSPYRGPIEQRYLAFDAWLQRFAQRVSYICCLETSGKLPAEEAYRQLNCLSKELKRNRSLVKPGPGRVSSQAATASPPARKEAGSGTPAVCSKLGGIRR